jgi:muramidase (phage lysozyme)
MIALAGVPVNRAAFLDMIAFSEIGTELLAKSDNGYDVLVGGTLFNGYADHPRQPIFLPKLGICSTAAGRYQLLARYFDDYKALLGLPDFSPDNQDAIALQQIRESGLAMDMIDAGNLGGAIGLCAHLWASLPGSCYGQPQSETGALVAAYQASGGTLA